MEVGLDPERFWQITPLEMAREMKATIKRMRRDREQVAWAVWHVAALGRVKDFPKLHEFTGRNPEPAKPRDWRAIQAEMMAFAQRSRNNG